MAPYQDYKAYTARFISEFGFESAPDLRTLHQAITNPKERHSQSKTFDIHDKGPGHSRRYPMYMGSNFRFQMNPLSSFVCKFPFPSCWQSYPYCREHVIRYQILTPRPRLHAVPAG